MTSNGSQQEPIAIDESDHEGEEAADDSDASDKPEIVEVRVKGPIVVHDSDESDEDNPDYGGLMVVQDDEVEDDDRQRGQLGNVLLNLSILLTNGFFSGDAERLVNDFYQWLLGIEGRAEKEIDDPFVRRGLDNQKKRKREEDNDGNSGRGPGGASGGVMAH